MSNKLIAKATLEIHAPLQKVWDAFVDPAVIKQYMFGTEVTSNWEEGSSITWKGVWNGNPYEDKGTIKRIIPLQLLQYTHFSPPTGAPDELNNYHTVTVELFEKQGSVIVSLSQDNNKTKEERAHSEENWNMMLDVLKKLLEQ
jgi:uncharacterized protein YndB with AHSA1/START domain